MTVSYLQTTGVGIRLIGNPLDSPPSLVNGNHLYIISIALFLGISMRRTWEEIKIFAFSIQNFLWDHLCPIEKWVIAFKLGDFFSEFVLVILMYLNTVDFALDQVDAVANINFWKQKLPRFECDSHDFGSPLCIRFFATWNVLTVRCS